MIPKGRLKNGRNIIAAAIQGVLYVGLASCPMLAAEGSPAGNSDTGGFIALIGGLMLMMFGGMALCYGIVKLAEKAVKNLQARHAEPSPVRHFPRAA